MYRCGWATKEGQEVVLAVWLDRAAFDQILALAVPSSFDKRRYTDRAAWSAAVHTSDVRLQWDPDHDPHGRPVERRAIQLGLRGTVLASYARPSICRVEDITAVRPRAAHATETRRRGGARDTDRASVSCVPATATALGISAG